MGNFIKEFLDKKLEDKHSFPEIENSSNFVETKIENEEKNIKTIKDLKTTKTKQMINIKKKSYKKEIMWIIAQLILGILFISASWAYLQKNEAEKKFFDSSIQYWKNIAVNLYSKLGGKFEEQVDEEYMKKRQDMIVNLEDLNLKLNACIAKEKNKTTLNQLKKLRNDILGLKRLLSSTDDLPMHEFNTRYQFYSLWVKSFESGIDNYCK